MKILFLLFAVHQSIKLTQEAQKDSQRTLFQSEDIYNELLSSESKINIEEIKTKVVDMHSNVKYCIETEFNRNLKEVLPLKQIFNTCVGQNYSILIRFYQEIIFILKEITKEKIKNQMQPEMCNNKSNDCLKFFVFLDVFMEKQIDVLGAFRINQKQIKRDVSKEIYEILIQLTEKNLGDYNTTISLIREERRFLIHFLDEKMS